MLCNIIDPSSLAMVAFVRHALLNSTHALLEEKDCQNKNPKTE